jgi:peptidoglycan hydrolase-like protein with peptidoglycan-binding domain
MGSLTPADIEEAHGLLAGLGLRVGIAGDGRIDARTANAIRMFQLRAGLKVTGHLTPELLERLRNRVA